MTIEEVLAQVDELKPNTYDDGIKISWLSKLDAKIFEEVIKRHSFNKDETEITSFDGYTIDDMSASLLATDAYADMYIDYCFAMIDYNNQEFDKYANSTAMFENKYQQYVNHYNRHHMPLHSPLTF